MNMLRKILAAAVACIAYSAGLHAQGYPNKPIRIFIGYAPGGSADAGARPRGRALPPPLGPPLILHNPAPPPARRRRGRPGGGAARAPPAPPRRRLHALLLRQRPAHRRAAPREGRL